MPYWDDGHMDDGTGIVMVFAMVALWVLVAVAIFWIVRSTRTALPPGGSSASRVSPGDTRSPTGTAEQILAERLARGEIDPEEYRARVEALRSQNVP
jgi:putative membrane protein